jgi:succinate-semialdehyde dehydrogenase/glutarate-semialdehyde dehydrogenase
MNEEPFGPVALINRYAGEEAMIAEANRLPYGLAAYAGPATPSARRRSAGSKPECWRINTTTIGGRMRPSAG